MSEKISVIIPTYGRSKFISRAIDSVINQTHKNLEVIIVDDNNSDSISRTETELVLKKYSDDKRVFYYKRDMNGGGSAARNSGIQQATGQYISFLDDDDYYYPEKIARQLSFLKANLLDVCICDMDIVNNGSTLTDKYLKAQCDDLEDFILHGVAYTPMILMEKSVAISISGFSDTPRFQDHIFMYKLLKNGFKIGVLNERLAVHNDHDEARITSGNKSFIGYKNKMTLEKEFMAELTSNAQSQLKMNHFCIESKIITDTKGYLRGVIYSAFGFFYIRSVRSMKDYIKNLYRNIFQRNKHF